MRQEEAMPDEKRNTQGPTGREALTRYFAGFEEFSTIYSGKAVSLLPEKELAPVVQGLEAVLREQIRELSKRVLGAYDQAPQEQKDEWDMQFRMLGGSQLIESSLAAARSILSGLGLGNVGNIAILIKKLINTVFGTREDSFLDRLLEFIDEVLGETAHNADPRAAETMHIAEARYLDLQVRLARLEAVKSRRGLDHDD
jgi:hypothetical protein